MNEEKPQDLKEIKTNPAFGMKDIATIILLIFVYPIGLIFMWFAVKWPKWIKIILTIPVFLAIIGIALGIIAINALTNTPEELPINEEEQVFCTQEAMLCPDGVTYVGREGPNCEFAKCPQTEPGDTTPTEDAIELPETSSSSPSTEPEELFPSAPIEE